MNNMCFKKLNKVEGEGDKKNSQNFDGKTDRETEVGGDRKIGFKIKRVWK
jgi:hypothetical protein